jgi:hypothetical protein
MRPLVSVAGRERLRRIFTLDRCDFRICRPSNRALRRPAIRRVRLILDVLNGAQRLNGWNGPDLKSSRNLREPRLLALARRPAKSGKIKPREALHLACAETGKADYFVTCDDDVFACSKGGGRLRDLG